MSARREWRLHDHPRRVVVGALEVSLLQQRKTETEACFDVLAVFAQQVTEDLFSLRVLAFANCSVPFGVSLLVSGTGSNVGRTGECKTKHEGGHTEGRHPGKTPIVIALHDHTPEPVVFGLWS